MPNAKRMSGLASWGWLIPTCSRSIIVKIIAVAIKVALSRIPIAFTCFFTSIFPVYPKACPQRRCLYLDHLLHAEGGRSVCCLYLCIPEAFSINLPRFDHNHKCLGIAGMNDLFDTMKFTWAHDSEYR